MSSPVPTVVRLFAAWKGALLLIAVGSAIVGPAYDTSGGLLLADRGGDVLNSHSTAAVSALLTRLVSWDAIYFVESADRGYVFEQEWAFGYGNPSVISCVVKGTVLFFFFPSLRLFMFTDVIGWCRCFSSACQLPVILLA